MKVSLNMHTCVFIEFRFYQFSVKKNNDNSVICREALRTSLCIPSFYSLNKELFAEANR